MSHPGQPLHWLILLSLPLSGQLAIMLILTGRGMVKGAVKTSEFLFHGSEYAKQHIVPEGARAVDPKVTINTQTQKNIRK